MSYYNVDDITEQDIKGLVKLMSGNPELAAKFNDVFAQIAKHQGWVRGGIEGMLEEQKNQNSMIVEALRGNANALNELEGRLERIEKSLSDTAEDPPRAPTCEQGTFSAE